MKIFKKISALILLTALTIGFNTNVLAAKAIASPMSLSNGFYGEALLGYGNVDATDVGRRDDGFAGALALGYKFNEYVAADVGYTHLPRANVPTYFVHAALKGILPLGDGSWDFFGKLGGAFVRGQRNLAFAPDTRGNLYYGAGFTYWFQQNFGALFESTGTTGNANVPSTYTILVGLTYFF